MNKTKVFFLTLRNFGLILASVFCLSMFGYALLYVFDLIIAIFSPETLIIFAFIGCLALISLALAIEEIKDNHD